MRITRKQINPVLLDFQYICKIKTNPVQRYTKLAGRSFPTSAHRSVSCDPFTFFTLASSLSSLICSTEIMFRKSRTPFGSHLRGTVILLMTSKLLTFQFSLPPSSTTLSKVCLPCFPSLFSSFRIAMFANMQKCSCSCVR